MLQTAAKQITVNEFITQYGDNNNYELIVHKNMIELTNKFYFSYFIL